MPQMSPLNWLQLFFYFQFLYFIMITLNYYIYLYKPKMLINNKYTKKNIYWKW